MDGWTITKVWEIDNKLVVADTIEEAIALIKLFAGEDYSPMNIRAIGNAAGQQQVYTIPKSQW